MTKWRKQETFKENTKPVTTCENFSNIPMFNVLKNSRDNNMEDNNTSNTPIVEGFDWEGVGYFHHHSVFDVAKDSSKIKEFIEKIMSYFSSPIANVDSMIEKFIYDLLIAGFMLNNQNCANKSVSKLNNTGGKVEQSFFWLKTRTEGFTLNEQPYLIKTVDSFEKNHKDFITDNDTKMKVGTYYINSLNSYETKIRRRFTADELFLFNNDFDNLLNDPTVQNKIKGIVPNKEWHAQFSSESKPIYENTEEDYKKYYDTNARFKMDNTDRISYYKLNEAYFPIPVYNSTNKKGIDIFNDAINEYEYINSMLTRVEFDTFNKNNKYAFTSFNATSPKPPDFSSSSKPDIKYIYSIDTTTPSYEPAQDYLTYVIKYFSLIIFSKLSGSNIRTIGFQDIEARVGTIYTNLLNRLDFLQYNQYQSYLDSYRISIFNHMFFILLQQQGGGIYDKYTDNIYFKITDNKNTNVVKSYEVFQQIIKENNVRYLNIRSQDDLDKMSMNSVDVTNTSNFPSLINITSSVNLENTISQMFDTGDLPLSTTLNPFVDNKDTNLQNILQSNSLPNYILNSNFKSKEMEKYYMPGQLSECERMKRRVRNEFTNYAKIIKKEIYRILFIPVVLYIVYNMYYMFFFRDASGRVRYENGEYINKGFACKNPLFPDWESYFHSYDKHTTNIIFEYVFKPAKMIYTLLNAFKAIIRTYFIDINFIPPYIFLFATLLIFNDVAKKHGQKIMRFYNDFYNTLSLPNTKTWNGWKDTAKAVTIMFFILTCVKDVFGFNWHEMLQLFAVSTDSGLFEDNKEPKQRSWIEFFLAKPVIMLFLIIKVIIFILYWIFKYSVTIQMIPFALFIAVIYFTYTVFFAIYNNSDSECSYLHKRELIDRIIYTRLYDVPKNPEGWDYALWIFKSVCWMLMVFMIELLSVWTLKEGLNKITSNIGGSKYADGLKLILITIYTCIFCLIGLWCFYKYTFKLPIVETFFSREKDDPEPTKPTESDDLYKLELSEKDGTKRVIFNKPKYLSDINKYNRYWTIKNAEDRRFTLEKKKNCDTYEILTENSPFRIILGGDILNKIMIKEEIEKKKKLVEENKNQPSFTDKWSGKILGTMGNIGDRILQKGNNIIDNMERSNKENENKPHVFSALKNMATSAKNINIQNIKSSAAAAASVTTAAASKAVNAVSNAASAVSGTALAQMKDSTALLNENIKDKMSSLFKI